MARLSLAGTLGRLVRRTMAPAGLATSQRPERRAILPTPHKDPVMPETMRTLDTLRSDGLPRISQLLPQQERPGLFAPPNRR